jgi:hypothetical protein
VVKATHWPLYAEIHCVGCDVMPCRLMFVGQMLWEMSRKCILFLALREERCYWLCYDGFTELHGFTES